jgi:hypothetical protein
VLKSDLFLDIVQPEQVVERLQREDFGVRRVMNFYAAPYWYRNPHGRPKRPVFDRYYDRKFYE